MKKDFAYWFLLIGFGLFFSTCDIINPEEQLPAYLEINNFDFTTTASQGADSEQITDVWVFVDDTSLGVYELPATVPVLNLGNQRITVFPVIRENGLRSSPIIYPFYERYETTQELISETIISINPSTTYTNKTVFELVEDFNNNGHQLNGGDPNAVQVVDGVGAIQLAGKEMVEFTSSSTFLDLPTSGGLPVFVEFDYKTNVELEIGLLGLNANPINPVSSTLYNYILCPINRWNKVYINLQPDLEASQLPSYKLAFRATINDTGCGNVNTNAPEVLIDNVKFVH